MIVLEFPQPDKKEHEAEKRRENGQADQEVLKARRELSPIFTRDAADHEKCRGPDRAA